MSEYDKLSFFEVINLIKGYAEHIGREPIFLEIQHIEALGKLLRRRNEIEAERKRSREVEMKELVKTQQRYNLSL